MDLTSAAQFDFADSLFKNKDYLAAKIEFQKFVYFFPQDDLVEQARFNIGVCLFYQKEYESALDQFQKLCGPSEMGVNCGLFVSRCYLALNDVDSAIQSLHALIERTDAQELRRRLYYQMAWIYVDSGDFKNASLTFEKIRYYGASDYPMDSITEAIQDSSAIPLKSPVLAGVLSVFPGGGYAYCGRFNDALVSLVINGACAAAAYESFDKDLNALGGIITAVGIGFYGGNIYSGISSAHKYNHARKKEFINNLKNQFNIDLMAGMDSDGVTVKVQKRF
jgi:tetratricopeptide (TPR) repeat protein